MPAFSKKSLDKLDGVHPDLVKVMKESIKECPIDFSIDYGVRTTKMQQDLYALGRTVVNKDSKDKNHPMGRTVTQRDGVKRKSEHQVKADGFGHAVDLYPYYNGTMHFNDEASLLVIATHIKATAKCLGIKIVWGGDWTIAKQGIVDKPHFQI